MTQVAGSGSEIAKEKEKWIEISSTSKIDEPTTALELKIFINGATIIELKPVQFSCQDDISLVQLI